MTPLALPGLRGRSPLGFLAALGVLHVLDGLGATTAPTLFWTSGIAPHAVACADINVTDLIEAIDRDRQRRVASVLFSWGPDDVPLSDVKPIPAVLRRWAEDIAFTVAEGRADADLFCGLVAEGAVAGKGDAKPTHLHFTAGQQRFLDMVRHLGNAVGPPDLEEALVGPWSYSSDLPSLGWDAGGERSYALRATDPAKEQRPGVPGADWLAFLGLTFLPVFARGTALRTTACGEGWKHGWFRWPLWGLPLSRATVRSLLSDPALAADTASGRRARGVTTLLQSPIRRTAQGGYGSFGPATLVAAEVSSSTPETAI